MVSSSTEEREGGQEVLLQHDPHPGLGVLQPGDGPQLTASSLAPLELVGVAGALSPEGAEICTAQVSRGQLCSEDGAPPRRQTDIPGALRGHFDIIRQSVIFEHLP